MKLKTRLIVGLGALALLLTSCIPSVYPFYFDKDLVPHGNLLGEWKPTSPDDATSWKFEETEQNGAKVLLLTLTEKEKTAVMIGHLFKLQGVYFLDITPKKCEFEPSQMELVGAAMIPGHLLIRISQFEPTMKLAFFDMDWLGKHLEKNPKLLAHQADNERMFITARTAELQKFVLKNRRELFGKEIDLARKPAGAPGTNK